MMSRRIGIVLVRQSFENVSKLAGRCATRAGIVPANGEEIATTLLLPFDAPMVCSLEDMATS